MPISIRDATDDGAGNRFVPARFVLPTDLEDPAERTAALAERLHLERAEQGLSMAEEVAEVITRLGPQLATQLVGAMMKAVDVTASNVPGFDQKAYIAGSRIDEMIGYGPCAGAAINIVLFSYAGTATLGITADSAAVPDLDVLRECLAESTDELVALGA